MCGVAGIVDYHNLHPNTIRRKVGAMCDEMRHRGPDDAGFGNFDGCSLGMRRLSIIGVSTGKQPLYNADKTIAVVGNGEIYNYQEIRKSLQEKGIRFNSESDIAIIPYLYECYGIDFLKQLRGMFALAIWDDNKKQLLLARDPLGKKPLYYTQAGGCLAFASELKALLASDLLEARQLNPAAISHYLLFSKVSTPLGALKGVHKVDPATCIIFDKEGTKTHRYWTPSFKNKLQDSETGYINGIEQILTESVKIRLQSEVPLGAFLSGGVDSSLVVAIMRKFFDVPVKTFSIGYEETAFSELHHARKVAKHLGTEHYEAVLKPEHPELLLRLQASFSEPFADSYLPLYEVSRLAKEHVTVVLTGDAGDENFGGYEWYKIMQWALWYQQSPHLLRNLLLQLSKALPFRDDRSGIFNTIRRIKYFAERLAQKHDHTADVYQALMGSEDTAISPYLQAGFAQTLNFESALQGRRALMDAYDGDNEVERLMYAQLLSMLTDNFFNKVDTMSMAVSVEARCPFADQRLTEYAARIPFSYKVKGSETKYILKKVAARYLPKEIIYRKKMGFGTPMQQWIKSGPYNTFFKDILFSRESTERGFFDIKVLKQMMLEHEKGQANHYPALWKALNLEMWCSHYL